jgi:hypothetical protein
LSANDLREGAQGQIHGLAVREDVSQIRIENDNVDPFGIAFGVLAANHPATKVVLRTHVIRIRCLLVVSSNRRSFGVALRALISNDLGSISVGHNKQPISKRISQCEEPRLLSGSGRRW